MSKYSFRLVAVAMTLAILLAGCTSASPAQSADAEASASAAPAASQAVAQTAAPTGRMTDLGTPRNQTLVVDTLSGRDASIDNRNFYIPGGFYAGNGYRQLVLEPLWEVDSINAVQIPVLADSMAEPLDGTYTKFHVKLREGVYWSDGVEFTAEDVIFTSDMIRNTPEFGYHAGHSNLIKSITATDKYNIIIETNAPAYRLELDLGVAVTGASFNIVAKHIWEGNNPATFDNKNAVGTGPYVMTGYDPQGNWTMYEKREDWQRSATGILGGEPNPKYVIFRTYGTEEKRIMAAINNDLDILCDIAPESWDILRSKNPEAMAWFDGFPYADTDNPATRGMQFNCASPPFDNVNVRWALVLATDAKSVMINAYSGMLKASALPLPPTTGMTEYYYKPMLPWLREFQLEDGYKPFDENFAFDLVELLKKQNIEGLPTEQQAIVDTFGVGWWKYDPSQAEKMLINEGFSKKDGKWYLPDGTLWSFSIVLPSGFESVSERLGYAMVDNWSKFGIDVVAQPCDNQTFWALGSSGQFQVGSYWPTINVLKDATGVLKPWHSKWIVPIGENSSGSASRWENAKVSEIIDRLEISPPNASSIVPDCTEVFKELVKGMPMMGISGTSKFIPAIAHYWTGFQTNDNKFESPWWWCSNFRWSLAKYQPTGAAD